MLWISSLRPHFLVMVLSAYLKNNTAFQCFWLDNRFSFTFFPNFFSCLFIQWTYFVTKAFSWMFKYKTERRLLKHFFLEVSVLYQIDVWNEICMLLLVLLPSEIFTPSKISMKRKWLSWGCCFLKEKEADICPGPWNHHSSISNN